MGKTKKNRNAKQGIDTMGVSTSEIAKEISKPQTATYGPLVILKLAFIRFNLEENVQW